jgi:hypothetical protein
LLAAGHRRELGRVSLRRRRHSPHATGCSSSCQQSVIFHPCLGSSSNSDPAGAGVSLTSSSVAPSCSPMFSGSMSCAALGLGVGAAGDGLVSFLAMPAAVHKRYPASSFSERRSYESNIVEPAGWRRFDWPDVSRNVLRPSVMEMRVGMDRPLRVAAESCSTAHSRADAIRD